MKIADPAQIFYDRVCNYTYYNIEGTIMMQKATRYFVSIALCLSLSLITTPSPTTATILIGIDLGALAGAAIVGLALKSAFTIGASLGQATRGKCLQTNLNMYYNRY